MQLYLHMFTFEYAHDLAFIYTTLEVAVTATTCSEVKCVFQCDYTQINLY